MLRRLLIFLGVLFVLGSLADAASAAPVLLGSVPIGSNQAVQVAVNSGLNRVYVAGPMGVTGLEVVNVASLSSPTLVTTLPYGGGVTVDPATNHFFSSDAYGGHIVTFNGSTNAAIATTAESGCGGLFDFDPVRNVVDQVTQCIDALNVMNASTFALTGSRSLGGVGGWVAVNSATGDAYAVVNYNQTRVYGPPPGLGLITTLPGEVVAVNPLTNRVYLWPGSGNNLTVYDGATNTPVGTVPGGAGNIGVSCGGIPNYNDGVDTGLNRLYVRNSDCSNLLLVDGASNTVTGTLILPGGNEVRAVTVDSARHLVYVVVGSFSGAKTLYIYSDQAPVPNPNDQLTVQRAEQFIGLGSGETKSVTVSCPSGYEVLDGSPLVQQIDHGLPSFVQIMQSQSTSPGAYTFTLRQSDVGQCAGEGVCDLCAADYDRRRCDHGQRSAAYAGGRVRCRHDDTHVELSDRGDGRRPGLQLHERQRACLGLAADRGFEQVDVCDLRRLWQCHALDPMPVTDNLGRRPVADPGADKDRQRASGRLHLAADLPGRLQGNRRLRPASIGRVPARPRATAHHQGIHAGEHDRHQPDRHTRPPLPVQHHLAYPSTVSRTSRRPTRQLAPGEPRSGTRDRAVRHDGPLPWCAIALHGRGHAGCVPVYLDSGPAHHARTARPRQRRTQGNRSTARPLAKDRIPR